MDLDGKSATLDSFLTLVKDAGTRRMVQRRESYRFDGQKRDNPSDQWARILISIPDPRTRTVRFGYFITPN